MSYTKGPWKFGIEQICEESYEFTVTEKPFDYQGEGYYQNPYIFGADGEVVVGCDEYYVFRNQHDARLIAAAPDLLEVLEEFIQQRQYVGADEAYVLCEQKMLAAIAKATGETQ